jgi:hypothetical protein
MLEYRHFPWKKALSYAAFSSAFAYSLFSLQQTLFQGDLPQVFTAIQSSVWLIPVAAVVSLILTGYLADRLKRNYLLTFFGALIPIPLDILHRFIAPSSGSYPIIELAYILSLFCGLAILGVSWTVMANKTIVLRYRGRVQGIMLLVTLILIAFYNLLGLTELLQLPLGLHISFLLMSISLTISIALRPWKWKTFPLAVSGNPRRYLLPMLLILMAHFLWYHATTMSIENLFRTVGDGSFTSLAQYSGLTNYETLIVGAGAVIAGFLADFKGRKTAFNTLILSMGLLAIFSSTFYRIEFQMIGGVETARVVLEAMPLLVIERLFEGFLLGLCVFLIWTELGSPKSKGMRLAGVLALFAIYISIFWASEAAILSIELPDIISVVGTQFAVVLSLVALYTAADLPEMRGREVEMEDLSLDFSDKMVRETVDAFVQEEDLDSIRSQVDLIEIGGEISDQDFDEIMGEEFNDVVAFRDVKGIGPAMEKKLRAAGYKTVVQLAGESPSRLSRRVEGIGEERAESILKAARSVVKNALKNDDRY